MAKQFGNETSPSYCVAWILERTPSDHVCGVIESPLAPHVDPSQWQPEPVVVAGRNQDLIAADPKQATGAPPAVLQEETPNAGGRVLLCHRAQRYDSLKAPILSRGTIELDSGRCPIDEAQLPESPTRHVHELPDSPRRVVPQRLFPPTTPTPPGAQGVKAPDRDCRRITAEPRRQAYREVDSRTGGRRAA